VVGDGRERKALEEQARRLGIMPHTTFWGIVRDMDRLIPAFDVFVMPSRREGTPMLLYEAMNAGAPIVVAPVGGIADVVTEEEAMLVPTDNAAATAAGIRRVLRDPPGARFRALRARQRLKKFEPGPWLDQYEELYEQLAGRTAVTAA
jgi:glycosyltransferase involved in cell wall biosynthesis